MANKSNVLYVEAKKLGFVDLDFPSCADSLKKYIDNAITTSINSIKLDLRWCIIIYSQANVFLDSCIQSSGEVKEIIILTTDNYLTREMTCYEFFRTTIAAKNIDYDAKSVTSSVEKYCKENDLIIEIQVYSGDTEIENSPKLASYFFPDKD